MDKSKKIAPESFQSCHEDISATDRYPAQPNVKIRIKLSRESHAACITA
jgi:hypothetical protein